MMHSQYAANVDEKLVSQNQIETEAAKRKMSVSLFHTDPMNQAKIDRALKGETQLLKKDGRQEFFNKFTPQDFNDHLHKDERIIAIQQKYQKKNEEVYRQQQQIIGFIKPENMLESDWLYSIATNKQDEEHILANVQNYK